MKKIMLSFLLILLSLIKVQALENIPNNIYYINNDLYAYLSYDADIKEYCVQNECTVYIEYRFKEASMDTYEKVELIEILDSDMKNLVVNADSQYLIDNNYQMENILVKSRYVIKNVNDRYQYLDWSEYETITKIEIPELPIPQITDLNFENEQIYNVENALEIETTLKEYIKYYGGEIKYTSQYRINDTEWVDGNIKLDEVDLNDIKIEIRLKYSINNQESKWSNTLTYEKHPVIETCLFDSDICCNKLLNISLCIWLLIIFILLIIILIAVDNIKRRKREA